SGGRGVEVNRRASDKYWQSACEALEAPELASDPALGSDAGRAPRIGEIRDRLTRAIASKPLAHWMARLRAAGCIFSSFATPTEVQTDPQVVANGYLPRHPNHPTARLAASPVQFDETPIAIRRPAPPRGGTTEGGVEGAGSEGAAAENPRGVRAIK